MIRSLKRKFTAVIMAVLLAVTAGTVAAINVVNGRLMESQARTLLRQMVQTEGMRPPQDRQHTTPEEELPAGRAPREDFSALELSNFVTVRVDEQGEVTQWFGDRTNLYTDEDIRATASQALESGREFGRIGSQYFMKEQQPDGWLLVFLDNSQGFANARRLLLISIAVGAAAAGVLCIFSVVLVGNMTQPVQEAFEKQKRFISDAGHELKTPISVIAANADVLQSEIGENRWLACIQTENRRMEALVKSLLSLSRLEQQARPAHLPVDLSSAVVGVALAFESAAYEVGKTVDMQVEDEIWCMGDVEKLKQVTAILLDNAIKYASSGGHITLSLAKSHGKCALRVHNGGVCIPKEEQKHVFERFYRADASRSRQSGGSGLGLAIAKAIVDEHKGKIAVESKTEQGTTFTVLLSACDPASKSENKAT